MCVERCERDYALIKKRSSFLRYCVATSAGILQDNLGLSNV